MVIRKMKLDDYDKVYNLWMSCVGMGLNNLDDSKEGISRFLDRNPNTCFVAEDENNIIGVIMAGNDGRRGYIYHTSVHPDYRRQNIARTLVDRVMAALKDCGIHKVALLVFERNESANIFWEQMGFTIRNDIIYRNKAISEITRIDT